MVKLGAAAMIKSVTKFEQLLYITAQSILYGLALVCAFVCVFVSWLVRVCPVLG